MNAKEIVLKVQSLQKEFYKIVDYEIDDNPFGDGITSFSIIEDVEVKEGRHHSYDWTLTVDGNEYWGNVDTKYFSGEDIDIYNTAIKFIKEEIYRLEDELKDNSDELKEYIYSEILKLESVYERIYPIAERQRLIHLLKYSYGMQNPNINWRILMVDNIESIDIEIIKKASLAIINEAIETLILTAEDEEVDTRGEAIDFYTKFLALGKVEDFDPVEWFNIRLENNKEHIENPNDLAKNIRKLSNFGFVMPDDGGVPYLEMLEFLAENGIYVVISLVCNPEWMRPKYEYEIMYLGNKCIMMDGQKLEYFTRRECLDAAIKEAINYL